MSESSSYSLIESECDLLDIDEEIKFLSEDSFFQHCESLKDQVNALKQEIKDQSITIKSFSILTSRLDSENVKKMF